MICVIEKCSGCFACANICPKSCISMKEDEFGHIYPQIDESICIHCDMCKKVCPVNHPVEHNTPLKTYASWNICEEVRLKSTSGGLATTLSNYVIEQSGVVYGAAWKNQSVQHIRVDKKENLSFLQGSKYVHSYIKDAYQKVKKDLLDCRTVLFIGTPCQIAGLKNYLTKDYDHLILVDIICHGVPSQKLLKEELKDIKSYDRVLFRELEGFYISVYSKDTCVMKKPYHQSLYYQAFLDGITYRESCYSCPYANSNRISDLTIGDFWGLKDLKKAKIEEDKGISVVLINSSKGEMLLNNVSSSLFLEERQLEEAVKGNSQLRLSSRKTSNTEVFKKLYTETLDYEYSLKEALNWDSLLNKVKRSILDHPSLVASIVDIKKKVSQ